jgi:hypothetical protein
MHLVGCLDYWDSVLRMKNLSPTQTLKLNTANPLLLCIKGGSETEKLLA